MINQKEGEGIVKKVLLHFYTITQQAILSTHFTPGNMPGGDIKMSETVPCLRELQPCEGGR